MPVDMLISRFMKELRLAVPTPFRREGESDAGVRDRQLPPYRHVFHALCLYEHSNGYHLPRYDQFKKSYLRALQNHPRYRQKLEQFCPNGAPSPGLLHRIGGWYLDGLSHAHLYCALVQAYEEQRRIGAVMMDARVDAKLKTDIAVITPSAVVRVDIQFKKGARQNAILTKRAAAEMSAKANNASSSHLGNPFYEGSKTAVISHADMRTHSTTGVPLFTPQAIDQLIMEIDRHLGVDPEQPISYEAMRNLSMSDMEALHHHDE